MAQRLLLLPSSLAIVAVVGASEPSALADGVRAAKYYLKGHSDLQCGWTRATFMLGLIESAKATGDAELLGYARSWAEHFRYRLCDQKEASAPRSVDLGAATDHLSPHPALPPQSPHPHPHPPAGIKNANAQLCGSTYLELYKLAGSTDYSKISSTLAEFDAEIIDNATSVTYWSWVDTFFMAMNTWSRAGAVTGNATYFDKMWSNFADAALEGPDAAHTYHFWSDRHRLFYRDDRFLGTDIFWGRGNSWAMGGLVAALQHVPRDHPSYARYRAIFAQQSAALKAIQGEDGCWGASLLDPARYPAPETTGSAGFTYGLAYGVGAGLLDRLAYLPVVQRAWRCLRDKALQPSGLFGYCQPVGDHPSNDFNGTSTSDFCVGLFLLASVQVASLEQGGSLRSSTDAIVLV